MIVLGNLEDLTLSSPSVSAAGREPGLGRGEPWSGALTQVGGGLRMGGGLKLAAEALSGVLAEKEVRRCL